MKGPIYFVLLTYGISWSGLLIVFLSGIRMPEGDAPMVAYLPFLMVAIPTSFGPALAAWITRKWITKEGFSDVGLKLPSGKSWGYIAGALFYPLIVLALMAVLLASIGSGKIEFTSALLSAFPQLLAISVITSLYTFGEEFGWRGYLQARLAKGNRALFAAVITGLVSGVWHYPMLYLRLLASDISIIEGMLVYPLSTIGISIIYGWFYFRSQSIWTASVAHAASNNLISNMGPILIVGASPLAYHLSRPLAMFLLIIGCWLIYKLYTRHSM